MFGCELLFKVKLIHYYTKVMTVRNWQVQSWSLWEFCNLCPWFVLEVWQFLSWITAVAYKPIFFFKKNYFIVLKLEVFHKNIPASTVQSTFLIAQHLEKYCVCTLTLMNCKCWGFRVCFLSLDKSESPEFILEYDCVSVRRQTTDARTLSYFRNKMWRWKSYT